jgi:hypothetical protein
VDNNREEFRLTRTWSRKLRPEDEPTSTRNNPDLDQLQKASADFNARVHHALAEIPVPPELREQILARRKIIPVSGWRRHQALLRIAAAFLILGTLAAVFWRPGSEDKTFAGFRSRMVAFAIRQYSMDIHTNQLASVQGYLASRGAPAVFGLPAGLAARPVIGGASFSWQGKPVGMVCFKAVDGKTLYMFVVDSASVPGSVDFQASPQKSLGTVAWRSGGKTFLIAGEMPLHDLEQLVKS